ncbi:hypothetical protein POM88_040376 [Heracleum sosnowskyi]|uniref:Uncharacterized protein n=1 Tax=Heracleum sosnowskyi TaxID=360622 RepID=A0AAD8M7D3_9APIA|nr:hypothetical protein POM88_040376 [Heracleum sosnowskyi]
MDWSNAIVKEINKDEDGSIKHLIRVLNLEGSVKATKLKITWLPHTNELVPLSLMEFDYLITKKKETLYIHHGIQGGAADGKGVICKSDVDGVIHHGIQGDAADGEDVICKSVCSLYLMRLSNC